MFCLLNSDALNVVLAIDIDTIRGRSTSSKSVAVSLLSVEYTYMH